MYDAYAEDEGFEHRQIVAEHLQVAGRPVGWIPVARWEVSGLFTPPKHKGAPLHPRDGQEVEGAICWAENRGEAHYYAVKRGFKKPTVEASIWPEK